MTNDVVRAHTGRESNALENILLLKDLGKLLLNDSITERAKVNNLEQERKNCCMQQTGLGSRENKKSQPPLWQIYRLHAYLGTILGCINNSLEGLVSDDTGHVVLGHNLLAGDVELRLRGGAAGSRIGAAFTGRHLTDWKKEPRGCQTNKQRRKGKRTANSLVTSSLSHHCASECVQPYGTPSITPGCLTSLMAKL
jgi:hypothetical protein